MFPEPEAIYQCPVTKRFYDPLAVKRALRKANGAILALARATADEDEDARLAAEEKIAAAGRAAFGLAPVDATTGSGVPEALVLAAVTAFTRWLRGKGETAQSGPTSAPCTDCP